MRFLLAILLLAPAAISCMSALFAEATSTPPPQSLRLAIMMQAVQLPPIVDLNVPLVVQRHRVWCWAATAQMIMTKLGVTIDQCDQASNAPLGQSPCCVNSPPQGCLHSGEPQFERWGFSASMANGRLGLAANDLMSELAYGRPLAYARRDIGNPANDLGHIMVLSGYDNNFGLHFFVRDPLQEIAGLAYEEYVGGTPNYGFEHARTYYNIRRTQ